MPWQIYHRVHNTNGLKIQLISKSMDALSKPTLAPMPLLTTRLSLNKPEQSYAAELALAVEETWDSLSQFGFMTDMVEKISPLHQKESLHQAARQFTDGEALLMIGTERSSGQLAIVTGLSNIDWSIGKFTVHYWVRKRFHGLGYATEAVHALLIYARDVLGAKSVGLGYADGNVASQRIAEKLGFEWLRTDVDGVKLPNGKLSSAQVHVCWHLENVPPMDVSWGFA
jgi:RimJ/RimL family protein N-acetyltransferase